MERPLPSDSGGEDTPKVFNEVESRDSQFISEVEYPMISQPGLSTEELMKMRDKRNLLNPRVKIFYFPQVAKKRFH